MNMLKILVLLGVVFVGAVPNFSSGKEVTSNERTLTVKSSFSMDSCYYVCLSDDSCFVLNKVLIHKGSGWFGMDKYGNPAANWLIGDPISIERTGDYEWPFYIINLCTQQSASASSCNFEARHYERMYDGLRDLLRILKEIQSDISVIRDGVKNIKQENLLKNAASSS